MTMCGDMLCNSVSQHRITVYHVTIMQLSLLVLLCALLVKTDTFHEFLNRVISPNKDLLSQTTDPKQTLFNNLNSASDTFGAAMSSALHSANKERESSGAYWEELVSALNHSDLTVGVRKGKDGFGVTCEGGEMCWRPMVTTHWPRLLNLTGYNTDGRLVEPCLTPACKRSRLECNLVIWTT